MVQTNGTISEFIEPKELYLTGVNGWFLLFGITHAWNTIIFVIAYFIKDDISIIDIGWGSLPIVPMVCLIIDRIVNVGADSISTSMIITTVLVCIWGFRLIYHIASRHKGEDARYTEMRKVWAGCPKCAQALVVMFNVFGF